MATLRRKFTTQQKTQILQEAAEYGITKVLRQHNLSYSVFTRWKQQREQEQSLAFNARAERGIEELEVENARLKKIIANQAIELEMMNEILRKK